MPERILLINSDLAKNRGDRAIAEGNIQLIRSKFPGARIVGISQHPERDSAWYGIEFLRMDFQSLNPLDLLRLMRAARHADRVLWGGGEILKDYTNKAALWYWVIKITLVTLVNREVYGAFQGIGPTSSPLSRRLITGIVDRCAGFIVRDAESYQKLRSWGASSPNLLHSSDPAVLPEPAPVDAALAQKLRTVYGIDEQFLSDAIYVGPRDWFHYRTGGVIPFKYKRRLAALLGRTPRPNEANARYREHLVAMMRELTTRFDANVMLVPMHLEEGDGELCELLRSAAADPGRVRVVDRDELSPAELRSAIAGCKAAIGFRLHSNIIGVSANVPSLNIYYVDKGRVFFDQIGQSARSMPIERVLEDDFAAVEFVERFGELLENGDAIRAELAQATERLRADVVDAFDRVFARG
ncbi:polysaccharide pyruvyl transferase family protein [Gryllotalpicola ginsengisoli]|uniref:polysaccharide pyruvyl transferase family protein n=1 Tax=Gryllotalpicola ginsengisoli TaxID=444608 RepID=UPI0003B53D8B|nr:polysaccharide pyruvyl transferase family protein [Gryllotalpicola ginsengisoli]